MAILSTTIAPSQGEVILTSASVDTGLVADKTIVEPIAGFKITQNNLIGALFGVAIFSILRD